MGNLTEAIERVRRSNAGEPLMSVYAEYKTRPPNRLGNWSDSDAAEQARAWLAWDHDTLASAYVAERDPTPVDEAWLRSVGFGDLHPGEPDGVLRIRKPGTSVIIEWGSKSGTVWIGEYFNQEKLAINPSRGYIRHLAAALGIELEETR